MYKEDVLLALSHLDDLNIDRSGYFVCYGAALVLYGVKKITYDIDVVCDDDTMAQLTKHIKPEPNFTHDFVKDGSAIYFPDSLKVFNTSTVAKSELEWVDGYQLQSLDAIISSRLVRNSDRDKLDIGYIMKFIFSQ